MLSIGTITVGGGYQYLTKEVTSGAEGYYMRAGEAAGESQGWWLGAQRETFGISGTVVEEQQMAALFGTKTDPNTGERLGSRFRIYANVADRCRGRAPGVDRTRSGHPRRRPEGRRRQRRTVGREPRRSPLGSRRAVGQDPSAYRASRGTQQRRRL